MAARTIVPGARFAGLETEPVAILSRAVHLSRLLWNSQHRGGCREKGDYALRVPDVQRIRVIMIEPPYGELSGGLRNVVNLRMDCRKSLYCVGYDRTEGLGRRRHPAASFDLIMGRGGPF